MWSIGVYDFGLTSEQFWRLTPAQFHALSKKRDDDALIHDSRMAQVICTMRNVWRGKNSRVVKPEDILPSLGKAKKKRKPRDLKAEWDLVMIPQQNAIMKVRGR